MLKKYLLVIFISSLIFIPTFCAYGDVEFYVAIDGNDSNPGTKKKPFATIERARDAIRDLKTEHNDLSEPVNIYFREGTYYIDELILFTPEDSGTEKCPITYQAYPGEKPVISGGKKITGKWEKGENGIWSVNVPEVHTQQWWFRQLFKNGERQIRSSYPNEGDLLIAEKVEEIGNGVEKSPRKIYVDRKLPFENLQRKEAEAVMYNLWSISRARIRLTNDNFIQTITPLGWIGHGATSIQEGRKMHLEHALEFIDQPGEWYLDRDKCKLYYMPEKDENPNNFEWTAPFAKQLLRLLGRKGQPVTNIKFENLSFEYTNWQLPIFGYSGIQAGFFGSRYITQPTYSPLMAILCEYAEDCKFNEIELSRTGTSGLGLGAGCKRNRVSDSKFYDIGGSGIQVGWRRISDEPPRQWFENGWHDTLDIPKKNSIVNNKLLNCGKIHLSSTAIFTAFAEDTLISHNEIHDMPHIGITVGFIWSDRPTSQKRAIVEYNHIYNCMKKLIDGAGIYTLGYQPGTVIRNNYIHDILNGHGLYTDEGSSHILFENNIIYRTGLRGFNQNYGHHNIVRNNIFAYPCLSADGKMWGDFEDANFMLYERYLEPCVIRRNRGDFDVDQSFNFNHNVVIFNKGDYFKTNFGQGTDTFKINKNVIWDTRGGITEKSSDLFEGDNLENWQKRGHDTKSIFADPGLIFKDGQPPKLSSESPAFDIGFKKIDLNTVGIQNN